MFTPSTGDGRARSEGQLFRPRVMNKLQRRPTRLEHPAPSYTRPHAGYPRGAWASCFSLLVSPAADSYWANCLRYMCSVEQRSDYRTSKANGQRYTCVILCCVALGACRPGFWVWVVVYCYELFFYYLHFILKFFPKSDCLTTWLSRLTGGRNLRVLHYVFLKKVKYEGSAMMIRRRKT